MKNLNLAQVLKISKWSLATVWVFTGLTSLFFAPEIGFDLLKSAGLIGMKANLLVVGGSLLDIGLGVWLLTERKMRLCCMAQIFTILLHTILLTIIDASFWLHPFGPLTKNFPILALILLFYSFSRGESYSQKPKGESES